MSWNCTAYFSDARALLLTERVIVVCVYAAHSCRAAYIQSKWGRTSLAIFVNGNWSEYSRHLGFFSPIGQNRGVDWFLSCANVRWSEPSHDHNICWSHVKFHPKTTKKSCTSRLRGVLMGWNRQCWKLVENFRLWLSISGVWGKIVFKSEKYF